MISLMNSRSLKGTTNTASESCVLLNTQLINSSKFSNHCDFSNMDQISWEMLS